ncbi:MAG TPA: GspH/FimT family pseudopilin [bacterium]|nr:GspH/FimT family pseudopilin [bacterium]
MNDWRVRIGHRTGFTLLETLIVISLLGIALAITLPSYARYASTQRARAMAHLLASDLGVAQQEAITRRVDVKVTFSSQDAACPGKTASYWLGNAATVIKRVCFPPDVVWGTGPRGPVVFTPSGRTEAGAALAVQSTRTGEPFALSVEAETGVVVDATR